MKHGETVVPYYLLGANNSSFRPAASLLFPFQVWFFQFLPQKPDQIVSCMELSYYENGHVQIAGLEERERQKEREREMECV